MLLGSQTKLLYCRTGCTSPLYADSLKSCGHAAKVTSKAAKDPSLYADIADMCVPFQIASNYCYAKILDFLHIIEDSSLRYRKH